MTIGPVWSFQHSVECAASRSFAWTYWTNIANWNDPPAKFELDGPFAVGSRLTTTLPDQTLHSVIRYVEPGYAATIDMELPDGVLSFHWTFEDLSETRSRITQRLTLSTDSAALVAQARVLEQSVPQGMKKLMPQSNTPLTSNRNRNREGRLFVRASNHRAHRGTPYNQQLPIEALTEAHPRPASYLGNLDSTSVDTSVISA
jgi:hypothetical protein